MILHFWFSQKPVPMSSRHVEIMGRSPHSRFQKAIRKFNRKQSFFQVPQGTPSQRGSAASTALYAMGTNAQPALPALTNLLLHTNALINSSFALAGIGSDGVKVLIMALTNQNAMIRDAA